MRDVEVILHEKVRAKGAYLFTGLPGVAWVGKIAVDYMISKLDPEKVATILSKGFPPQMIPYKKGMGKLFSNDLYFLDNDPPVFFLAGDAQPPYTVPAFPIHYDYAESIVKLVKRLGVSEIYALAGKHTEDRLERKPEVVFVATDEEIYKKLESLGVKPDMVAVTGAAGLIPAIADLHGIPGATIMGETSSSMVQGDPEAARGVIEVVKKLTGLDIPMEDLDKDVEKLRKAIETTKKALEQTFKLPEEEYFR